MTRAYGESFAVVDAIIARGLDGLSGLEAYFEAVIDARGQLMMPGFGAPGLPQHEVERLDGELRRRVDVLVARGRHDGTVSTTLRTVDVVVFASLLAQGLPEFAGYRGAARSLVTIFLDGVAARRVAAPLDDLATDELSES